MEEKNKKKTLLFVCTGNSCRSQMAEGYMKHLLQKKGKGHIEVLSAGTHAYEGASPSENASSLMKKFGVDISENKSKPVTEELIGQSDLILAMSGMHVKELNELYPESRNKTYLLREFEEKANPHDLDVFDPVGLPGYAYENCFDLMKKPLEKLAEML
jgi:protein-tyrosine-phosphatase